MYCHVAPMSCLPLLPRRLQYLQIGGDALACLVRLDVEGVELVRVDVVLVQGDVELAADLGGGREGPGDVGHGFILGGLDVALGNGRHDGDRRFIDDVDEADVRDGVVVDRLVHQGDEGAGVLPALQVFKPGDLHRGLPLSVLWSMWHVCVFLCDPFHSSNRSSSATSSSRSFDGRCRSGRRRGRGRARRRGSARPP